MATCNSRSKCADADATAAAASSPNLVGREYQRPLGADTTTTRLWIASFGIITLGSRVASLG